MRRATKAATSTLLLPTLLTAALALLPATPASAQNANQTLEKIAELYHPPFRPFSPAHQTTADLELYAKHCIYAPDGSVWTFGPLLEELELFDRVADRPTRNRNPQPPWFIDINTGQSVISTDEIIDLTAKRIGLVRVTGVVKKEDKHALDLQLVNPNGGSAHIVTYDVQLSDKDTLYSANIADWENRTRQTTFAFPPNKKLPTGRTAGPEHVAVELKLRPATTEDLVENIHANNLKSLPVRLPRTYPAPQGERGVNVRWLSRLSIIRNLPEPETNPQDQAPAADPLAPFRFPEP